MTAVDLVLALAFPAVLLGGALVEVDVAGVATRLFAAVEGFAGVALPGSVDAWLVFFPCDDAAAAPGAMRSST